MVKISLYKKFMEQVSPDVYNQRIEKLRVFLEDVKEEVLTKIEESYDFDILEHKNKKILRKLISKYIDEILRVYPDEKILNRIYRLGKKIYKLGLSDVFILSIFSLIKSTLRGKEALSQVLEKRIETDTLLVLKPLTMMSIEIDSKIEKFTKIDKLSNDSIAILEKIDEAKKEHIRMKNSVIKDIFEDGENTKKIKTERCKVYKILEGLFPEGMIKNETFTQISVVHDKFHEYVNYYVNNKEKLNAQQKYLLVKEIESISLRMLFLLNQLQIDISNQLSFFDFLTESYNKNIFPVILQKEIKRAERYNLPLTVSMIDIDNFKKINDTYGHLIGDNVLKEVSKLIKANTRHSDYLFRFGGEEFILLLPHTDIEGAALATEKIRKKVESKVFTDKQIKITISCGISQIKHFDNPYIDLEEADKMLYLAKNTGKNKCCIAKLNEYEHSSLSG